MKKWRLILDGKGDGFYNMAVDEAVLLKFPQHKTPTLRVYSWKGPFISLGYRQRADEALTFKSGIPFTRRITGGGAILHDKEITYSITCRSADLNLPFSVKESYKTLCAFIIDFYAGLGLKAEFAQNKSFVNLNNKKNYCYTYCEEFDLTIGGKKIGGNAQRRKKDLIFQQGSIPQGIDFKMVTSSLKDVGDTEEVLFLDKALKEKTDLGRLSVLLAESFRKVFEADFTSAGLYREEREAANVLIENKYTSAQWNSERFQQISVPRTIGENDQEASLAQ